MRIVHIISGLSTGGAETMLHRLVNELSAHSHVIISLTSNGPVGQKLLSEGFDVRALNIRSPLGLLSLFKLWQLLREYKPDIIQTWMYHADLIGSVIGRLSGNKNIIWNIRNTNIPQGKYSSTGIVIMICAKLSYFVPKKIVCCAKSALYLHADLGYSKEKLLVIPNGYDASRFNRSPAGRFESKKLLGIPEKKTVVGIIGRFDKLKGYDIFAKASELLSNTSRNKYLFLAVGRAVENDNDDIRQLIKNLSPNAEFKLLGERSDIPKVMQALDVFCLASRAEGFPNVVAEAMLMEVPCVVTDVGDARTIVGSFGMVVPPEDASALADAIEATAALDSKSRNEIVRSARQRILDNYSIDAIAQQYETMYKLVGTL